MLRRLNCLQGTGLEHQADTSSCTVDTVKNERRMKIFLRTWEFFKAYICSVVLVAFCFLLSHNNYDSDDEEDDDDDNDISANIYWMLPMCQTQAKCLHTWSHLILTKPLCVEPLLSQFYRWRNEVKKRLCHLPRATQQEEKWTQSTCLNSYILLPPTWFHTEKSW